MRRRFRRNNRFFSGAPRRSPTGFEKTVNFVRSREVFVFFVVGVDVLGDPFRREILFSHRRAGARLPPFSLQYRSFSAAASHRPPGFEKTVNFARGNKNRRQAQLPLEKAWGI